MSFMRRNSILVVLLVLATIPLFSSCLWILMEKYDYTTDVVINNTDKHILILNYRSKARPYSDNIPEETIPLLPRVDTIRINPYDEYSIYNSEYGGGCDNLDFKRVIVKELHSYADILLHDSVHIFYKYIDSVEIIFDNKMRLAIVNDAKLWDFPKLNEFWINEKSDESCNKKKGCCTCTFTYFITEEMFEQAVPIQ